MASALAGDTITSQDLIGSFHCHLELWLAKIDYFVFLHYTQTAFNLNREKK